MKFKGVCYYILSWVYIFVLEMFFIYVLYIIKYNNKDILELVVCFVGVVNFILKVWFFEDDKVYIILLYGNGLGGVMFDKLR